MARCQRQHSLPLLVPLGAWQLAQVRGPAQNPPLLLPLQLAASAAHKPPPAAPALGLPCCRCCLRWNLHRPLVLRGGLHTRCEGLAGTQGERPSDARWEKWGETRCCWHRAQESQLPWEQRVTPCLLQPPAVLLTRVCPRSAAGAGAAAGMGAAWQRQQQQLHLAGCCWAQW